MTAGDMVWTKRTVVDCMDHFPQERELLSEPIEEVKLKHQSE